MNNLTEDSKVDLDVHALQDLSSALCELAGALGDLSKYARSNETKVKELFSQISSQQLFASMPNVDEKIH